MTQLPNDEIMRQLSRMALEQATQAIAQKAREFAKTMPQQINGRDALEAFASSIESTNEKAFGRGKVS